MPVLKYLIADASILGINSIWAYSANVFDALGTKQLARAEPSMINTSVTGSVSGSVTFSFKKEASCDFWQTCSFTPSLRDAGND